MNCYFLVFVFKILVLDSDFLFTFCYFIVLLNYFVSHCVSVLAFDWRLVSLMSFGFWGHFGKFVVMGSWRYLVSMCWRLSILNFGRKKSVSCGHGVLWHLSVKSSILVLLDDHFEWRLIFLELIGRMTESLLKILLKMSWTIHCDSFWGVLYGWERILYIFSIGVSILQLRHFPFEVIFNIWFIILLLKVIMIIISEGSLSLLILNQKKSTCSICDSCCLRS